MGHDVGFFMLCLSLSASAVDIVLSLNLRLIVFKPLVFFFSASNPRIDYIAIVEVRQVDMLRCCSLGLDGPAGGNLGRLLQFLKRQCRCPNFTINMNLLNAIAADVDLTNSMLEETISLLIEKVLVAAVPPPPRPPPQKNTVDWLGVCLVRRVWEHYIERGRVQCVISLEAKWW